MDLYTTCLGCGQIMTVTNEAEPAVHGLCLDRYTPTLAERQTGELLDALTAGDEERITALEERLGALHNAAPRLADAALLYASWGWPVFPLRPGDKAPLTRHGFKDATTDPARIRRWWAETPAANIGLPTGIAFDVIDIDPPKGCWSWTELVRAEALPPIHGKAITARCGVHLYVAPTGDGNLAGIKPGVDYRGKGGYVVAPPSRRPGGRWQWSVKPSPVLTGQRSAAAA